MCLVLHANHQLMLPMMIDRGPICESGGFRAIRQIMAAELPLQLTDVHVQWHLHRTAPPPPSAVRQSKDQLPDLLHQVAISFPSLTDQQQTTVVKELANLSQQVPDVLREPPSVRAKGRPPNNKSTKRDTSGFEYVDPPSKDAKPKRRKVTCGECNQVGHRRIPKMPTGSACEGTGRQSC
ncbi:hypothetical protein PsorP6_009694 [Peronosclerospora sorghi]|uniref:Uncharacterized protein n=1 Tax=Peronosclerospora sorghi TaxID=230839 RepID=A0ACC0W0X4_9STRA|nr:hypothetical protein PsorP6_009694 [Peronosclerospora sorghi]